jgi:hypothetical protein
MIASRVSGPRVYCSSSDTSSYLDNHPNIEENTSSPITMSGERRTHPLMLVSMCLAGGVADRQCTELGAEAHQDQGDLLFHRFLQSFRKKR